MAKKPRHGHAVNGHTTRVYNIWRGMRQRCNNPKASHYALYGGAGIKVDPVWDHFPAFLSWALTHGYAEDLTIERRDPTKDYSPGNCHWACNSEQQSNKRKRSGTANQYIGVYPCRGKWQARVQFKGAMNHLGTFDDPVEAAKVRDAFVAANSLPHRLNF